MSMLDGSTHAPGATFSGPTAPRQVLILTADRPTNHHILRTLEYRLKEAGLEPELKGSPRGTAYISHWLKELPGPIPLVLAFGPASGEREEHWRTEWADQATLMLQELAGLFASVHVASWGGAALKLPPALVSRPRYEIDRDEDLDRLVRDLAAALPPGRPPAEAPARSTEAPRPAIPAMEMQYASVADVPARRRFCDDVEADPKLLQDLLAPGHGQPSDTVAHWLGYRPLVDLLEHGATQAPETYALDPHAFARLRSVAPAVQPGEDREELFSVWREEKLAG